MIGREIKSFVDGLSVDRVARVKSACWRSVDKWEIALFVAGQPDASEHDELHSINDACGLCREFFGTSIERGDHRCLGCPLFVGGEPCYLRGTYGKIYDYLSYEKHDDLSEEFLGWVKEYGEQLIVYLKELIAEMNSEAKTE